VAEENKDVKRQRKRVEISGIIALLAFGMSATSFYRSYFYKSQLLEMTVTEVSYVTNEGGLYITLAFANAGNRDAALLRVEPALWGRRGKKPPEWIPIDGRVHPDIPITDPKMPGVVKAGGVELVKLSAKLDPADAEQARVSSDGNAFLGIRFETMNSDGNLYLIEHPVAKLVIDKQGRINSAEATISRSLNGFEDMKGAPPGDNQVSNKKTPFVWADQHGT
jgi:hypothetical protein